MSLIESPHGIFSPKQLTAMKVVDEFSVFVAGVPPESMDVDALRSDRWFGGFGEIARIFLLRNNPEYDVFLSFKDQWSGTNAITWCNGPMSPSGLRAENGYRRYCREFILNRKCQRLYCHELHQWRPFAEVLNVDEVRELNPFEIVDEVLSRYSSPTSPPPRNSNEVPGSLELRRQTADNSATELLVLQKNFNALQKEFDAGQVIINQIVREIQGLQLENANLRQQNLELFENENLRRQI